MNLRRIIFWILLIFTLFVVYESVIGPLIERLLRDRDVDIVANEKSIKPQGLALPLLIYFVWRIFKWSRPERLEEQKVELLISTGTDKALKTTKGNNTLFFAENNNHIEITSFLQAATPTTNNDIPQNNTDYSDESNQPSSMSAEEKIADFERRLNYKAKGLTDAQKEKLDAEFHNYARSRRLPD
jgi:hypothetical protein